jgi:hypothetical protein
MRKIKSQIANIERPKKRKNRTAVQENQLQDLYNQLEMFKRIGVGEGVDPVSDNNTSAKEEPKEEESSDTDSDTDTANVTCKKRSSLQAMDCNPGKHLKKIKMERREEEDLPPATLQTAKTYAKTIPLDNTWQHTTTRGKSTEFGKLKSELEKHRDMLDKDMLDMFIIPAPIDNPYANIALEEKFTDMDIAFLLEIEEDMRQIECIV